LLLTAILALASYVKPVEWENGNSLKYGLGIWHAPSGRAIPDEANWVVAAEPNYEKPRGNISVILNWYSLHSPHTNNWRITTAEELRVIEGNLKSVQTDRFWGIIFICEEHYRIHVAFNDDVNTTWFNERLLGYPLYLLESQSATRDEWMDEMFLRMIRGFYNYFHARGINVGITAGAASMVTNYRNESWSKGWTYYFGESSMAFVKECYDFVILYSYTMNLEDFYWTKQYLSMIDQLFQKQEKFWILTRKWEGLGEQVWEREATALEIKNCLDRKLVIISYYAANPPLDEAWPLLTRGIELYNRDAPCFEEYVYGKNLLTGQVGTGYGWVAGAGNYDGRYDLEDLAIITLSFGSYPGHPRWNPAADLNKDKLVNIKDIALMALKMGK